MTRSWIWKRCKQKKKKQESHCLQKRLELEMQFKQINTFNKFRWGSSGWTPKQHSRWVHSHGIKIIGKILIPLLNPEMHRGSISNKGLSFLYMRFVIKGWFVRPHQATSNYPSREHRNHICDLGNILNIDIFTFFIKTTKHTHKYQFLRQRFGLLTDHTLDMWLCTENVSPRYLVKKTEHCKLILQPELVCKSISSFCLAPFHMLVFRNEQ